MSAAASRLAILPFCRARRAAIARELDHIAAEQSRIGRELVALDERRTALLAEDRRIRQRKNRG